jgi:Uma2 family endonuclease
MGDVRLLLQPLQIEAWMLKTLRRQIRIGPKDQGRTMTLEQFDRAIGREGYIYELNKGVIEVSDVPQPKHGKQVQELRDQLVAYRLSHPGLVDFIAGSNESKILLAEDQSERHPDLSVYLTPPPEVDDVWSLWVPAIVIEVVSKSSIKRDYEDKPDEYLHFGVDEYWIVDTMRMEMTAMIRWRGQWKPKVLKSSQKYTTRHLPGFSLDLKRVFAVAK